MSKNGAIWSKESEQAVLGAILYDESVLPKIASILKSEDFYVTKHQLIFRSILSLDEAGERVDPVTVCEVLNDVNQLEKVGGSYFITGLFDSCPSAATGPTYAKKVWSFSQKRKLLEMGYQLYNGDPEKKAEALVQIKEFDLIPPWEKDKEPVKLYSLEALLNDTTPPPPQLINRGLLPAQSILLLTGAPKTGKSILALNLGLCLASGGDWFQFEIERPVKVLLLQSEVVYWALKERLERMKGGCEFPIPDNSFFVSEPFNCDVLTDESFKAITESISRIEPEVVLFDPLLSFHSEDENDNSRMLKVMEKFRGLTFLGLSIIIVHHSRKASDDSTIANPRGASSIAGSVDSVMQLRKKDGIITATFDLRYDEVPGEMTFKRNPESLWLEKYNVELEAKQNNAIVKLLECEGAGGKLLKELAKSLSDEFGKSQRTTRRWITGLSKTGVVSILGEGPGKRVVLSCYLD